MAASISLAFCFVVVFPCFLSTALLYGYFILQKKNAQRTFFSLLFFPLHMISPCVYRTTNNMRILEIVFHPFQTRLL